MKSELRIQYYDIEIIDGTIIRTQMKYCQYLIWYNIQNLHIKGVQVNMRKFL